jgi:hypothetical protein
MKQISILLLLSVTLLSCKKDVSAAKRCGTVTAINSNSETITFSDGNLWIRVADANSFVGQKVCE